MRLTNGEQCLTLSDGQRYRITAATRGAGRGLSVDVLLLDELREHRDYLAWAALSKTTLARPEALICAVSNAGDDQSVVLNDLRARAIDALARCHAELLGAEPGATAPSCSDRAAAGPVGRAVPGRVQRAGAGHARRPGRLVRGHAGAEYRRHGAARLAAGADHHRGRARFPGHRPAERVPDRTAVHPGGRAGHRVRPGRVGGLRGLVVLAARGPGPDRGVRGRRRSTAST